MIEYQQFINWLKTKNALDLYIDEFNKFQQKLNSSSTIPNCRDWMRWAYNKTSEDIFNIYGSLVLNYSFDWTQSGKGKYRFWWKLSEEFQIRCHNNILSQKKWNINNL
jgi:hypothetical protein